MCCDCSLMLRPVAQSSRMPTSLTLQNKWLHKTCLSDVVSSTGVVPLAVCTVLADLSNTMSGNMFKQYSHLCTSIQHGAHYFLPSIFQIDIPITRRMSHEVMFLDSGILQTAITLSLSYLYRQ